MVRNVQNSTQKGGKKMAPTTKGVALVLVAACFVLGLFASIRGSQAQAAPTAPPRDAPPVAVSSQMLMPSANSEVILKSVQATIYSDGSVRIRGAGRVRPGEHVRYSISVDLKSGLYTTKKQPVEPSLDEDDGYFIQTNDNRQPPRRDD